MLETIFTIALLLLLLVGILLIIVLIRKKSFGSLAQNRVYSDTKQLPGEVLYADSLFLKGKPDYILKKGEEYIPVEVKTGKTPTTPYQNHIMQLMVYCALIEENYGQKPNIGIIKYPEKEFTIAYTEEMKLALQNVIDQMREIIETGKEPLCFHKEHQISLGLVK